MLVDLDPCYSGYRKVVVCFAWIWILVIPVIGRWLFVIGGLDPRYSV